jgi:hypothetical protein
MNLIGKYRAPGVAFGLFLFMASSELCEIPPKQPQTALPAASDKQGALTIPGGTILPIRLNTSLSSTKNKAGWIVVGRIMQDVPLPGGGKIRAGSKVKGRVVEVAQEGMTGTRISLQFDKLCLPHETVAISTDLRAIAGFMEVASAQAPTAGMGEGDVWNWEDTTLIGGDSAFGVGGPVTDGHQVVGTRLEEGLIARPIAKTGSDCRADIEGNENPQAFWVFSSGACGVYGLPHLRIVHAGRSDPLGVITLAADRSEVRIAGGAAMLLRVNGNEK